MTMRMSKASGPVRRIGVDGQELEVVQGTPDYGAEAPVVSQAKSAFSPDYAPEGIYEIAGIS